MKRQQVRAWVWRMMAAIGIPLLLLAAVEGALRLAGQGQPTAFFLPGQIEDREVWLNNPRYGWRFIPPSLARDPWPFAFPAQKAPGTLRIFVLGESAAMGDPDPRFGLARVIEALLRQRFPERRFEVINVAFTAINSHVVLPIARECARREGDLWVIYMGNNEVIGPYGPGTVFGKGTPSLPFIRANLALKRSRLGQTIHRLGARLQRGAGVAQEWGGMEMFLDNQVRHGDPPMKRVYQHFERNLEGILKAGQRSDAPMVLSTVGTNLRDCAPFGSLHRPGMTAEDRAQWDTAYGEGAKLQDQNDPAGAAAAYHRALAIDDQHAELHFRLAICLHALDRLDAAQEHYRLARDHDALRFRADSRLNQIIRDCTKRYAGPRLRLLDAEALLAQSSPDALPGRQHFYEHVHLTPSANYQLARATADLIVHLLGLDPDTARSPQPWASEAECWRWLGLTDRNRYSMLGMMLQRMSAPPFTRQFGHSQDLAHIEAEQNRYRSVTRPTQIKRMAQEVAATVALRPDDAELRMVLAELLDLALDPDAEDEWLAAIRRLPNSPAAWNGLGRCLQRLGRRDDAAHAYRQCLKLFPWHNAARAGLQQVSNPAP